MRIQHNIMAMNAYRNYTNNVSAMKSNLEKLSSGYKINRAGDDAAGLAISEKMRAQITGLQTAQKNAKDGISLVQTAEGALTEVHDMLNRMVELATQSANGTYSDTTDREQLQKEIDQLRSEINRIADSSNFNGIKLLDGSMSSKGSVASTSAFSDLPKVGTVLGTDTVLHKDQATPASKTIFSVELHNQEFANATGTGLKITIGNDEFTLQAGGGTQAAGTKMTASNIVDAFKTGKFANASGTTMTSGKATIGGVQFNVTGSGSTLTFTQANAADDVVKGDMTVTITGLKGGKASVTAEASVAAVYTAVSDDAVEFDLTGGTASGDKVQLKYGGTAIASYTVTASKADDADAIKAELLKQTITYTVPSITGYTAGTVSLNADNKLEVDYTKDAKGAVATAPTATGFTLSETTEGKDAVASASAVPAKTADDSFFQADYNVSTTNIQTKGEVSAKDRLASTRVTVTKDMIAEGNSIRIGATTYTFSNKTGTNLVDLTGLDAESSTYISDALERLTKAAATNSIYTVGHDDGNTFTVTEKATRNKAFYTADGKTFDNVTDFDLRTKEGIDASLGFGKGAAAGKGLTLQIGDTADSFNQLKVDIDDCHTTSLGIASISVADQESAAKAVDAIKAAINKVSDVRGTLGATQNRLDHTINNLSVMTENIQDAESTIRDVDVAEEMMAYTKNNILIQSAQAMLAQANQVPQGVLQLLQ